MIQFLSHSNLESINYFNMQEFCRSRYGELSVVLFKLFSCSMCYKYLFHTGNQLVPEAKQPWKLTSVTGNNLSINADVTNQTVKDIVCNTLTEENCSRWTDCCYAAISCCQAQLATPNTNASEGPFCPRTWDGYACFGDTFPGNRVHIACPSYVEHASVSGKCFLLENNFRICLQYECLPI